MSLVLLKPIKKAVIGISLLIWIPGIKSQNSLSLELKTKLLLMTWHFQGQSYPNITIINKGGTTSHYETPNNYVFMLAEVIRGEVGTRVR